MRTGFTDGLAIGLDDAAIGMIKANPKLAAEVLPYGGKFSTAAVTPPEKPTTQPR